MGSVETMSYWARRVKKREDLPVVWSDFYSLCQNSVLPVFVPAKSSFFNKKLLISASLRIS